MKRLTVWVSQQDAESLRTRYPGERGGIDWAKVIRKALSGEPTPPLVAQEAPSEPFQYWKPGGPGTPMDERCQAQTTDGRRCKAKGAIIVKALDDNGVHGEFNACHRHAENFQPHRTVLKNLDWRG